MVRYPRFNFAFLLTFASSYNFLKVQKAKVKMYAQYICHCIIGLFLGQDANIWTYSSFVKWRNVRKIKREFSILLNICWLNSGTQNDIGNKNIISMIISNYCCSRFSYVQVNIIFNRKIMYVDNRNSSSQNWALNIKPGTGLSTSNTRYPWII